MLNAPVLALPAPNCVVLGEDTDRASLMPKPAAAAVKSEGLRWLFMLDGALSVNCSLARLDGEASDPATQPHCSKWQVSSVAGLHIYIVHTSCSGSNPLHWTNVVSTQVCWSCQNTARAWRAVCDDKAQIPAGDESAGAMWDPNSADVLMTVLASRFRSSAVSKPMLRAACRMLKTAFTCCNTGKSNTRTASQS